MQPRKLPLALAKYLKAVILPLIINKENPDLGIRIITVFNRLNTLFQCVH